MSDYMIVAEEVMLARQGGKPIVALESTVITHGLPYPENLALARNMEQTVRGQGAVPATIGVLEGVIYVGLRSDQLEFLAQAKDVYKISVRDFAPAVALKRSGGTTVAGTLLAAHKAGLRVFATGGIGGVHRLAPAWTVSPVPVRRACGGCFPANRRGFRSASSRRSAPRGPIRGRSPPRAPPT